MSQKSSFVLKGEAMLLADEGSREIGLAIGNLFVSFTRWISASLLLRRGLAK